jgi:hypothetical protein
MRPHTRTPRDPPKILHFYYPKDVAAKLQQDYKREVGRARESEEKFGQHGVTMKVHAQMRRGGLLLRERGRRDPPCMLYKCPVIPAF